MKFKSLLLLLLLLCWCPVSPAGPPGLTLSSPALVAAAAPGNPGINRSNLVLEYLLTEGAGTRASNTALGLPPYINLLKYQERFALAPWASTSTHVTAAYADDPFGAHTAARLLVPSSTVGYCRQPVTVLSGPYVVSFYVASNTGEAQVCRLTMTGISTDLAVPATGWTRVSYTASQTAGTVSVGIRNGTGDVACDLLFACPTLTAGTVAPTYVPENGELASQGSITWGSGYVSIANSAMLFGYTHKTSQSAITLYNAFRWPRANSPLASTVQVLMSDLSPGAKGWSMGAQYASIRGTYGWFGGNSNVTRGGNSLVRDDAWHIMATTYDGANAVVEIDGYEVGFLGYSPPATIDTEFPTLSNNSTGLPGDYAYASQYSVSHNRAQRESNRIAIKNALAVRGIAVPNTPIMVIEGHSKSFGVAPYAVDAAVALPASIQGRLYGVAGNVYGDMSARRTTVKANGATASGRRILVIWIGHNDFVLGTSTATLVAQVKSYCQDMAAVFDRIIVCTETPSTVSGVNTARNAYNAALRADPSFYTQLADIGADATLGSDSAAADTSLFYDGIHLTPAANTIAGGIIAAQVALALP